MSKSVVIVDDSDFVTKSFSEFLKTKLGYNVVAIGRTGVEAVELYTEYKPDVITMDISMPIKDGYQALREIMSNDPMAKVIMITAVRGLSLDDCLKNGAIGYIEKPLKFSDETFVEHARQVFESAFVQE